MNFDKNLDKLKEELEFYRKKVDSQLIPDSLLEQRNYTYIKNAQFQDTLKNVKSQRVGRLLEEKDREYENLIELAHKGKLLDLDLNDIYSITPKDLEAFSTGAKAGLI